MKQEIDKSYLNSIKKKIIDKLYLKNGHEDIIKRMEGIQHVYVSALEDECGAKMRCQKTDIIIDKQFCIFDENGTFKSFDPKNAKLIESQIGHEVLHAASRDEIIKGSLGFTNDDGRGLNEGVTQMITENVFGYVVNPFTDSNYKDFKKMAKIITNTIRHKKVLRSYFYHENDMKDACNQIAGNNSFFDIFNKHLTGIYKLKELKRETKYTEQVNLIRKERINLAYKSLIVNIVIPHLKTLTEEEKYEYIKKIIRDIDDDRLMSKEIIEILKSTINKSDEELKQIKEQLSKKEKSLYAREDFVRELNNAPAKALKKIFVDQTGKVSYKLDNNKIINIKNEDLLSKVYEALYDNNPKHHMYDYEIENIKNKIKNGEEISFNTGNVLKRKIWLAKIKSIMAKEGIVLLNNFNELNTIHKIIPKTINVKKGILEYHDLRKIAETYKLNHENNVITVINRKTNLEVSDTTLKSYAIFANFWLDNAKTYEDNNKEIPGIDSAYNFTNRQIYNDIMEIMKKNMIDTGKLNNEELNNYATKNPSAKQIIDSIFRNPKTYEVVYDYMTRIVEKRKLSAEKEITLIEKNYTNYNEEYIDRVTKSILSK